jgi:hypothetical protein
MRGLLSVKTSLDALEHQVTEHLAGDVTGRGDSGHHLPIVGIEREGGADALTVPAGDLEAILGPSEVRADRDDLAIVSTPWRLGGVALQQESGLRHQSVNAFVVQPGEPCALTLSIEQCPDPTITARRPIIRQRSDGCQDLGIRRLLISPSRASPFAKTRVKLRARDCNDPPFSAQVRLLRHRPSQGFSCRGPGGADGCCRSESIHR